MTAKSSFGIYLQYLRELRGISITQLAKLSDVSPSYISRIENGGRRPPKPEILKKIAPHLGIGYNELMVKAGYLTNNSEDLRIEDDETKELFVSLTESKKELLKTVNGMSEDTISLIAKLVQQIKQEAVHQLEENQEDTDIDMVVDEPKESDEPTQ